MKDKIKKLNKNGFFLIYFSSILGKVITLFGGVLIVRMLTQEDYAVYTLVINAFGILSFFGDFGATSSMLQYAIENTDKNEKQHLYFKYGLKVCLISALISAFLILISRFFYPFKSSMVANYTTMLFLVPFLTIIINYIAIILRAKEKNKLYSIYQIITTMIHYIVIIIFTNIFGLKGSLFSQYIYNILILLIGLIFIKKKLTLNKTSYLLSKKEKKDFLKLSVGSQINNTISSLLYTVDIFVLGILIVSNVDISYYKVATIIPNALAFLPNCLMIYLIPKFVKNRKNKNWIVKNIKKIFSIGSIFYGILSIFLIIFSKLIITILYGKEYILSSSIFNVLIINFFITSTFKIPVSNLLYSMHKVNINILTNVIGIFLNFVMNLLFVNIFGVIGAAYATLLVSIVLTFLNIFYLRKTLKKIEVIE